MIQVICCSSILSAPGRAGAFCRDFTIILTPGCRAFSGALTIEKLNDPLIPGPEGAVDTNDWCTTHTVSQTLECGLPQNIPMYGPISSINYHVAIKNNSILIQNFKLFETSFLSLYSIIIVGCRI